MILLRELIESTAARQCEDSEERWRKKYELELEQHPSYILLKHMLLQLCVILHYSGEINLKVSLINGSVKQHHTV